MPSCRAVSSGTVLRVCSAWASSSAMAVMVSGASIALLRCSGGDGGGAKLRVPGASPAITVRVWVPRREPGHSCAGAGARLGLTPCGLGLHLVAEFVLPLLPAGQFPLLAGAGIGEAVGAHGHGHLRIVGALDHRLGV